jgi:peptidoglycan-associated lipoprotein
MKSNHRYLAWRHWALAGLLMATLFGCSRCQRGDRPLTQIDAPPTPSSTDPSTSDSSGTPVRERPRSAETIVAEELQPIYFAYDSDELDGTAIAALEDNARWLRENPDYAILVEGHCDERGTDEYNYNLGERRANAVMGHLQRLRVPNALYTRSYGETRPAREGHTESAWRWNRRAQFSLYAD